MKEAGKKSVLSEEAFQIKLFCEQNDNSHPQLLRTGKSFYQIKISPNLSFYCFQGTRQIRLDSNINLIACNSKRLKDFLHL